ncbi:hypothetical protein [Clostridium fungisolvens]|uniref:Uncharacterized protein n=1 Tax=Clostridium fungisolvens TaxID=1604897 RepID=A0A6V8SG56_9CLOT|nr:hypothetical protein [Clostridium fungisolvens]GFP76199.1 hypothetical protein bsdtw1_02298 [Clostridium fungisolvens]
METSKFRKLYLLINIPIMLLFFILLITPIFITDRLAIYYVGIAARILLGIWCIFNGLWNSCTDYYSFLKNNRFQKNNKTPRWAWFLLLIVGVECIITAFMGYGFNGVKKPI